VCLVMCVDDRISLENDSNQATLTINNTQSTDTGCYSVQLVNIHGSERMYSSVTIEGAHYPSLYTHKHFLTFSSSEDGRSPEKNVVGHMFKYSDFGIKPTYNDNH